MKATAGVPSANDNTKPTRTDVIKRTALLGIWLCMALLAGTAIAAEEHKVVVQVSDDDARTQRVALNNTMNLLAEFGSKAEVEIVAYGPGLSLLTANSRYADRVTEMAARYGVVFSACPFRRSCAELA